MSSNPQKKTAKGRSLLAEHERRMQRRRTDGLVAGPVTVDEFAGGAVPLPDAPPPEGSIATGEDLVGFVEQLREFTRPMREARERAGAEGESGETPEMVEELPPGKKLLTIVNPHYLATCIRNGAREGRKLVLCRCGYILALDAETNEPLTSEKRHEEHGGAADLPLLGGYEPALRAILMPWLMLQIRLHQSSPARKVLAAQIAQLGAAYEACEKDEDARVALGLLAKLHPKAVAEFQDYAQIVAWEHARTFLDELREIHGWQFAYSLPLRAVVGQPDPHLVTLPMKEPEPDAEPTSGLMEEPTPEPTTIAEQNEAEPASILAVPPALLLPAEDRNAAAAGHVAIPAPADETLPYRYTVTCTACGETLHEGHSAIHKDPREHAAGEAAILAHAKEGRHAVRFQQRWEDTQVQAE